MPVTTIDGRQVHVNDEGFLTEYDEWDEESGRALAAQIGIELTDEHWKADPLPARRTSPTQGETADPAPGDGRRHPHQGSCSPLFPKKPAKKMAYIAGLPKPHGCV